ncbi:MAG TPA: helix-turn-helix transcriptional regulator [Candidatus Angelobacter sp.]|jgi:transcriptional regulator with XRE-family HTH domain
MEIWLSGIRQNRLARELHVDETVLSKVINGYREPSTELRALLAEYFNKNENWLFHTEQAQPMRGLRNGTTNHERGANSAGDK